MGSVNCYLGKPEWCSQFFAADDATAMKDFSFWMIVMSRHPELDKYIVFENCEDGYKLHFLMDGEEAAAALSCVELELEGEE